MAASTGLDDRAGVGQTTVYDVAATGVMTVYDYAALTDETTILNSTHELARDAHVRSV